MLVRVKNYRPAQPPHGSFGWSFEMEQQQGCVISVIVEVFQVKYGTFKKSG